MKVNLFVIGGSKCGSTFLNDVISYHPSIEMSPIKEPNYFCEDITNSEIDKLYENDFCGQENIYLGESSTKYSRVSEYPGIAKKIFCYNADAKIIYIVRNPIKRLKSAHRQALYSGQWVDVTGRGSAMSKDFSDAIRNYKPLMQDCLYYTNIKEYLNFFPSNQVKVIYFEDLVNNTGFVLRDLFDFLGVNYFDFKVAGKTRQNKSHGKKVYPSFFYKIKKRIPDCIYKKISKYKVSKLISNFSLLKSVNELSLDFISEDDVKWIKRELISEVQGIYKLTGCVDSDKWSFLTRK